MVRRCLAFLPVALVLGYGLWTGPKYDRFVLPAFDGHVYAAMAESPRVFTLAPWGYRILEPWIVHVLPGSAAAGFFGVNLVLLSGTVYVVGAWVRRLGFSSAAAALAASALASSSPMRGLLEYQVLVDPLAILLLAAILYEMVDPDLLVLMALFAAATLCKEASLAFLVLAPIALIPRLGWVRGVLDSAVVAAPALGLTVLLRLTWGNPVPAARFSILEVTLGRIIESSLALAVAAAMSGLLFLALVGLFRETSVELRIQGVVLWFVTFGLVLLNPYHYSVNDLPRLSIFAWPALLPLALSGLGFKRSPVAKVRRPAPIGRTIAPVFTLLISVGLVASTDSYARAPFEESPDPVAMVGRIRESLKTANVLEEGGTFAFDADSGRFAVPVTERFNLTEARQQRWFLYRGFGRDAVFGSGAPGFRGEASILIPILVPRTARIRIAFKGPDGARVTLAVSGLDIGWAAADGSTVELTAPARALVRGDNLVRLRGPEGASIGLLSFEVRLMRPVKP